jgi:hypothetical protein
MSATKTFTIEEARQLLPKVRQMIVEANEELEQLSSKLEQTNIRFESAEARLDTARASSNEEDEFGALRASRLEFQTAIEVLSQAQREYLERLNIWVDRISETGVILRDLRTGLLDFPAKQGKFEYFICWKLSDPDVEYWHQVHDGFIGRRPLAVLSEYF